VIFFLCDWEHGRKVCLPAHGWVSGRRCSRFGICDAGLASREGSGRSRKRTPSQWRCGLTNSGRCFAIHWISIPIMGLTLGEIFFLRDLAVIVRGPSYEFISLLDLAYYRLCGSQQIHWRLSNVGARFTSFRSARHTVGSPPPHTKRSASGEAGMDEPRRCLLQHVHFTVMMSAATATLPARAKSRRASLPIHLSGRFRDWLSLRASLNATGLS